MFECMCVCMHAWMFECMCVCMYACMHGCMCVCMHACYGVYLPFIYRRAASGCARLIDVVCGAQAQYVVLGCCQRRTSGVVCTAAASSPCHTTHTPPNHAMRTQSTSWAERCPIHQPHITPPPPSSRQCLQYAAPGHHTEGALGQGKSTHGWRRGGMVGYWG